MLISSGMGLAQTFVYQCEFHANVFVKYLNTVTTERIILFAKDRLMSKPRLNRILWGPAAAEPVIRVWTTRSALAVLFVALVLPFPE